MAVTKKGHQFENPAMDALLAIVLSLGNEVYVMRDRMRIVEKMLETKEMISRADIEAYKPTPEEEEEIRKDNDAFISRLFRVFEGEQ
ncbi:MAG: hypothetical protein J2P41_22365 [Blastocatellia bacterium]|nr:hypothetical protein [Blastocatellia bacterium]